jgi:CAAX prenyl protease-like protein
LISPDFESVSFRRFSWLALLISSVVFGLLHGDRWFVGFIASVLYTLVLIRRAGMGDAVVAHATTNALLAADVLAFHHWHLW